MNLRLLWIALIAAPACVAAFLAGPRMGFEHDDLGVPLPVVARNAPELRLATLGQRRFEEGDPGSAAMYLSASVRADPENPYWLMLLSKAQRAVGDVAAARASNERAQRLMESWELVATAISI